MKVLAVAPCFDQASEYSFKWYERLRDAVKDKVELNELLKEDATRDNFERLLETIQPDAVVYYNHGSESCLAAQSGGCVLDTENVDKVAGKIVYSMACLSAKTLGVEAFKRGCVYVGYIEAFTFTTYDEEFFCEAANSGFIAHVNGETDWGKIKELMIQAFNKMIDEAKDAWTQMWLRWDRDILRVYGEDADTPDTGCAFRKIGIRLFGAKIGWKLTRKFGLGIISFLVGWGIALGKLTHTFWEIGGLQEVFALQGDYVGYGMMMIGFLLLTYDHIKMLKKASA